MPDSFGQKTPQEVLAAIQANVANSRAAFAKTAAGQSAGGQAGLALAAIFAGPLRKTIDTRRARRSEAERLTEESGMSPKEARAAAKANVPRDFASVRKAKAVQKAMSESQEIIKKQTPIVGVQFATYAGRMNASRALRKLGLDDEATQLSLGARAEFDNELKRLASVKDAKAKTAATVASTEESIARRGQIGVSEISELLNEKESILAQIDSASDPAVQRSLNDRLLIVNQNIAKKNYLFGKTDADLFAANLTKPTVNKLQANLMDAGNQLDLITNIGKLYQPEYLTWIGQGRAGITAVLEKAMIPVGVDQKKFLADYSSFKRSSLDGLNRYIKLITGAQMSEAEASRLRKAFPDVEQDSPTQFMAKYIDVTQQLMAYRRRAQTALESGRLDLLPTDFKAGEGADIAIYKPSEQEALDLLGLNADFDSQDTTTDAANSAASGVTKTVLDMLGPN